MKNDILKYIANSDIWEKLKAEVIVPKINEIGSVMHDIVINKVPLKPKDAYNTKAYTTQALLDIIAYVDVHKNRKTTPSKERFE